MCALTVEKAKAQAKSITLVIDMIFFFFWIVGLVDRDRSLLMSKISPRSRRVTISWVLGVRIMMLRFQHV